MSLTHSLTAFFFGIHSTSSIENHQFSILAVSFWLFFLPFLQPWLQYHNNVSGPPTQIIFIGLFPLPPIEITHYSALHSHKLVVSSAFLNIQPTMQRSTVAVSPLQYFLTAVFLLVNLRVITCATTSDEQPVIARRVLSSGEFIARHAIWRWICFTGGVPLQIPPMIPHYQWVQSLE